MSYPILYSPTETNFNNNGIGILADCISCVVTEEANGAFELEMKYPIDGIHYESIASRFIIKSKANQDSDPQLFRIYSISKPMSGIISVFAAHISYDLSGIPVSCFAAQNAPSALSGLLQNAAVDCPFTFITDKTTEAKFEVDFPGSIRSKLGGQKGSILDVYGGEYEFDNYNVILHNRRGRNRGVSIRYGKNLTDIKQDINIDSVVTGVYPYWVDFETGETLELDEKIVNVDRTFNFVKIKTLDVSSEFTEKPTQDQMREYTRSYIKSNNIGSPTVSLSVSFAQLEQSEEYKGIALLEKVSLFDTVNVEFPKLKVSATAKAVKIVYDVILDRVENVVLGNVNAKITDTLANQQQQISQAPTRTDVQKASAAATAWLTNGKGYKVERRDENGNTIDTLYMDTQDIDTAVNVLRIGQSGIGFSQNGVGGPYYSAWTIDGVFDASWIKTGILSSRDGSMNLNLNTNVFSIKSSGGNTLFEIEPRGDGSTVRLIGENQKNMILLEASNSGCEFWFKNEGVGKIGMIYYPDIDESQLQVGSISSASIRTAELGAIRTNGESTTVDYKNISWKSNDDGTYTLIGTD